MVWLLKRKNTRKKRKRHYRPVSRSLRVGWRFPAGRTARPELYFLPLGCGRAQDASKSAVTLSSSSVFPLFSWRGDFIFVCFSGGFIFGGCLVFFLLRGSWQGLLSMAISQRECSRAAKKGRDAVGDPMNSAPPSPLALSPALCTVLGAGLVSHLTWHRSAQCHRPHPWLASALSLLPFLKGRRSRAARHGAHCQEGSPTPSSSPVSRQHLVMGRHLLRSSLRTPL